MNSGKSPGRKAGDARQRRANGNVNTKPQWLRRLILTGKVLAVVVAVLFVSVKVLFLALPRMSSPKYLSEEVQVGGLVQQLVRLVPPSAVVRDAKGRELFQAAINEGHWNSLTYMPLLSYNGPVDKMAEARGNKPVQIRAENCSYTAPYGRDIVMLGRRIGMDRRVMITFNGRNWNNYPDRGVIVFWSDADRASWLTFEEAERDWGITWDEWSNPSEKLLGKKAPFEFTHE